MNDKPKFTETEYVPDWSDPAPRFMGEALYSPPSFPLKRLFAKPLVRELRRAAKAKGAPVDYVAAGILTCAGAAIAKSHRAAPWEGWSEPLVLFVVLIGQPSSNKSPALDVARDALSNIEQELRQEAQIKHNAWQEKKEIAKIAEANWKKDVERALQGDDPAPKKPKAAMLDPEPILPRLVVSDATIEKLADIISRAGVGPVLVRDELAGILQNMSRYTSGGSDRPFFIEAYGGRNFTVERMGRPPVDVSNHALPIIGTIQPDRFRSLLVKGDDDGFTARFLPFWPEPAPVERPSHAPNQEFFERALKRLHHLQEHHTEESNCAPIKVPFTEAACQHLHEFRVQVREWEHTEEGLLLSFIGKLPGMAIRLATILAFLNWAISESKSPEPQEITKDALKRATEFLTDYSLPMARHAYAEASLSEAEKAAHRLVSIIRSEGWTKFRTSDVLPKQLKGLKTAKALDQALDILEQANVIRKVGGQRRPNGGRPAKQCEVNPKLFNQSCAET